ncbi:hypothetical protein DITRI_Ditri19aG0056700 [Diplodiscus trichospermus]
MLHSSTLLYTWLLPGTGGIKAVVPSHGADQFDEKDPREAKHMSSFFNFLLFFTISMFLGGIVTVAGWSLYRIRVVQGTSVIVEIIQVYVAAIRKRNLQLPENPLELYEIDKDKEAALEDDFLPHRDVYRFDPSSAVLFRFFVMKEIPVSTEEIINQRAFRVLFILLTIVFRFLDKAAIQTASTAQAPNPWKLCRVT